ncbi:MAG: AI-2E family transporter [Rhodobacteraceae bacterium]|nr:AI-2E family transporter [Paracoccaceae bacterium]
MSLTIKQQAMWWGTVLLVLVLALIVLDEVLLPYLVGLAIAYLLDPLADRLENLGCSRFWATTIISVSALLIVLAGLVFLVPLLIQQFAELTLFVPELFASLREFATPYLQKYAPNLLSAELDILASLGRIGDVAETLAKNIVAQAFSIGIGALNALLFLLVVPVVVVYMLADWDLAVAAVRRWLPRDHAEELVGLFRDVDRALAGFVRGQLTVCGMLAVYYAVLLEVVGLQFGLVVGVVAGALSFIPFVGSIGGGALAIGLAVFQFWQEPLWIGAVAVIFFSGQLIEQNFLTPRLVGKSIGLHPVWLLFALSAFGSLFGFVGLLVAVPASAAIGVFFRYGIKRYLASRLHLGRDWNDGN